MHNGLVQMIIGICANCKIKFRKREVKYKFCSLTCSSRHNRNGLKNVRLPGKSRWLAEFIGICLGDGCASTYQVTVSLNSIADANYVPYVLNLIKKLFPDIKISIVKRTFNMIDIKINSITVSNFMKKNGVISNNKFVPKWILEKSIYIKSCVRGLFDTEGSISFKQYATKSNVSLYKQLNFRNFNLELMTFVRDSLISLNFKPTNTLNASLSLSNHQSIREFGKVIGFSNPKLLSRSSIETIAQYQEFFQQ